jgi:hypothetical protein
MVVLVLRVLALLGEHVGMHPVDRVFGHLPEMTMMEWKEGMKEYETKSAFPFPFHQTHTHTLA